MPIRYQPPKLKQFDGRGNPRQHIVHFVETCNSADTHDNLLFKKFVRPFKEKAFDWYMDLEPKSIDSWEQLEINLSIVSRRTVSMMELIDTK